MAPPLWAVGPAATTAMVGSAAPAAPAAPAESVEPVHPVSEVDPAALFGRAAGLAEGLQSVRSQLWRLGSADLAGVVGVLGDLVRAAEAAMTGVTAEASTRGVVAASRSAGTTAWVREQAGITEAGRAHAIAQVAETTTEPGAEPLAEAVWGGGVPVGAAHTMVKEAEKVRPLLPGADRADVLGHYLAHAERLASMGHAASDRTLRQLTREIIARYGEDALDEQDERAKECSTLTERTLPTGLVRFTLEVNQPDAARVRAAVDGLAAPRPGVDEAGQPVRDARAPARRRADALLELVARAQAADQDSTAGGCGLSGATTLVVTMDHATLARELARRPRGATRVGWGRGLEAPPEDAGPTSFAITVDGVVLTPAQVRQAACDAQIIPMLLGTDSVPLDVGEAERFATGHQRAAVVRRDGGCTFGGCDRPPGWCHAHHIRHWADGGPTDLDNLALLCHRHHTVVHRDDLTATRVAERWVWHREGDPPERRLPEESS